MAKRKTTIKKIKKRSGKIVAFSAAKIKKAIGAGFKASGDYNLVAIDKVTNKVLDEMEERFNSKLVPEVEQVQDLIEYILEEEGFDKAHDAFKLYRELHRRERDISALVDSDELTEKYLGKNDWRVKENANMTYSLQGLNNHVASIISANFWMNRLYSREARKAHLSGDIHIHDLSSLSAYCSGWDLKDVLLRGFGGVPGKVNSAPPKHLSAALGQLVNFFYTLQGEVAGAVAVSNFDTYMAPFIRGDKLTYKEVKQLMQEFVYNMNVPTRVGFQTPFTNVTMDLIPTGMVADEAVIIGGKPINAKYKDYQKEIDMFNKAFAEVMMAGDAQGRVFTFPIPTYSITNDFDWDNPNLEPVWEMTRKYGIPYFSNYINSDMSPDDARSMCPLAASEKVLIKSSRGRGLEYSRIGNICEGKLKNETHEIYSDGKFVKGKFNKFTNQEMYLVKLVNGHQIKMSLRHENFVLDGEDEKTLETGQLKKGMYLPYSLNEFQGEGGNYDLGYFVGAFAGDGSFDGDTGVVFSLENHFKKELITKLKKISKNYFGAGISEKEYKTTKLYTLKIQSKAAVGLCRDFVADKEKQKRYRARLFGTSLRFRKGVFDGHYATDGGNRNRIYTSSKKMVQSLNMLAATMGTTTSIYEDNRENRLGKDPNWAVLFYKLNRQNYGDVWKKYNGKLWVKIKSIKKVTGSVAYCFEVKNSEPMFTVGTSGILTHNCRLRLDNKVLRKRGGIFAANPLTGSIGVVTINLPRLGYLCAKEKGVGSEKAKKEFFKRLGELMDIAKDSLITKREKVEKFTETGLYPYCKYYLSEVHKRNGVYWRNHFNTIGLNGMHESLINLIDKGIETTEGQEFALDVMDYMREKLLIFQRETGELFNLEATPAEGTSHRFARIDKQRYPDIKTAGDGKLGKDKWAAFYTNSTQLPVDFTRDIFEALDSQDELQCKYTGGTVFHGFLGEALPDTKVTKALVKKVAQNYKLPYFSITPTFSVCPKHGYIAGEHEYCPKCDEEIGWSQKLKVKRKK